ncbi:MAG: Na+/H+ antiporter NhaC family protein [Pseudomonadales bacterium]
MSGAGAESLLPVAVTLLVALLSRNVTAGLFTGVFVGVLMLSGTDPLNAAATLVADHLVPQITDSYNAGVLVLLAFIGGFVALMERSGGGQAFAQRMRNWLTSRARLQVAAWLGGITIFFSDLGTPLIVGPVFRPLADALRVSRQKLAYIVDSTASPVAILVPFIGWGVYIMSLLAQQFETLGLTESDYQAFLRALPFQFYAWLAVLMVPLLALLGLDYGAMARAERAVGEVPPSLGNAAPGLEPGTAVDGQARYVFLPLLMLAVVLGVLLVPLGFPLHQVSGGVFRAGLSVAYLAAAVTLMVLMRLGSRRSFLASLDEYLGGMSRMMPVAVMLVLAWALSDVGQSLGAGEYIAAVAAAGVPGPLLPLAAFLVAALISFATGSSWGTFAIVLPLALPAAVATGAPLYVVIGAVLSGGLFGDHSSPISETTILSATGAGSEQYAHFRTQLPYALTNGGLAAAGFVVAGMMPAAWTLGGVLLAQAGLLFMVRRYTRRGSRGAFAREDGQIS